MYFKLYSKNYKNPGANVYNYTGLSAVSPTGYSLVIAFGGWSSSKPTGLYISTSTTNSNNSILALAEQSTGYIMNALVAICITAYSRQLYIFDKREGAPSMENPFHILIYSLKYKEG